MAESKKNVVDLFAGVGGLSLGAARAGFNVAAAVEIDPHAVAYHAINFPNTNHVAEDVSQLNGEKLLDLSGLRRGQLHGLVGGPPCQGFSEIGLRAHQDPRNELFVHFFRLVAETRPAFFVAENVPGLTKERNKAVVERALDLVPTHYRVLKPLIIRASDFGAPTTRTRVFFIGYHKDRLSALGENDFLLAKAEDVRVGRALDGLPAVRSDWQAEHQSWRVIRDLTDGPFENRLLNAIPAGVGSHHAIQLLQSRRMVSGFLGTRHTDVTIARFRALSPGEADPVSKCVRLSKSGYCPTLRAGTGPERGSYQAIRPIHPSSPRVICPREAARLQGFPDWFQFHPTKWHAFRQIGNSVSPIVSEALMSVLFRAL